MQQICVFTGISTPTFEIMHLHVNEKPINLKLIMISLWKELLLYGFELLFEQTY